MIGLFAIDLIEQVIHTLLIQGRLEGSVLLTFLLATIRFSKHIRKRNATMLNLLLVTILRTIPPPLLYDLNAFLPRELTYIV